MSKIAYNLDKSRSKSKIWILAVISVPLLWIWLAMTATTFTWWSYVAEEHHILEILRLFMFKDQPMITLVLPTVLTIVYIYILLVVRRSIRNVNDYIYGVNNGS